MATRLNNIRANIQNIKFALAIGHGAHDPNLPPVLIPPNMYVVFLTEPGYLGSLVNTISNGWKDVFGNQNKIRQFLMGTLPRNQIPTLVTRLGLDWKKHVYGPDMVIANHILEMRDTIYPQFDSMAGLWFPGSNTNRLYYRQSVNLQQLVATARSRLDGKVVMFISGCRSDVRITASAINAAESLNTNGYFRVTGRQNYSVPLTNYLRSIQKFEQHAARYMTMKRTRRNNTERRVVRSVGASSGSNNNNGSNNLNARMTEINTLFRTTGPSNNGHVYNINPYIMMINNIKKNTFGKRFVRAEPKYFTIAAARSKYANFFPPNMTNENVRRWISSIKRSNNNLSNNIRYMRISHEPIKNNWRTNTSLAKRILHRIHTIENRRAT